MPSRITREGILSSDRVDLLSAPAEVFYRRLMSVADDYGRFDARASILIASCYPLRIAGKRRVTETAIATWIDECITAALVVCYKSGGKSYGEIADFRQQVRSASKFPPPPTSSDGSADACVADAKQVLADATQGKKHESATNQPLTDLRSTCVADATQTPSTRAASAHLDVSVFDVVSVSVCVSDNAREAAASTPPSGVSADAWNAWRKHRGKKLTPTAMAYQRKHLAEWAAQGHDPNRIVETALAGGWKGLYAPDDAPKRRNGQSRGPPTLAERRVNTIDNAIHNALNGNGKANHERTIEGSAERVDREVADALPGDLREPGRHRLRHSG